MKRRLNPQRDGTKWPAVLQLVMQGDAAVCPSLLVLTAFNEIQMQGLARPVDSEPSGQATGVIQMNSNNSFEWHMLSVDQAAPLCGPNSPVAWEGHGDDYCLLN